MSNKDTDETENVTELKCNWCDKPRNEVDKLIIAGNQAICNECVIVCTKVLENDDKKKKNANLKDRILDPVKIKKHLDKFIIGQDDAKQAISVAVVNHYKRIFHPPSKLDLEKSNVLMIGPTGSGKTLLAKTVANYLDVPFVIADATTLTESGYVGEDVENIISMLLANCDHDVDRAQKGIVFLDEIDKIGRKSENMSLTRDVSGEGVQQALLKLVEGSICRVPPAGGRKHPNQEMIEVDTKDILFIASGAFVGLDNLIREHCNPKSIGFGSNVEELDEDEMMSKVVPRDLVHYGIIPEFIGRFPIITTVEKLKQEDLVHILTQIKNSIIDQTKYYFYLDNVEIEFDQEALEAIADKAIELKTGARGLKNIIEKSLLPYQFNLVTLKNAGVTKITITENTIKNDGDPLLVYEESGDNVEEA